MGLEEKVVVTLYELTESGHHIEHDSPAIGAYQIYGRWSKSHGYYQTQEGAKRAQKSLIKKRLNEGYTEFVNEYGHLDRNCDEDLYITVKPVNINKRNIHEDEAGGLRCKGRPIRER